MYICQSQSPNSSYLPFPPWCLYIYSLCLCLYFCFANKIIYTLKEHFFLNLESFEEMEKFKYHPSKEGFGTQMGSLELLVT